jgi:hypothetical protein
MGGELIYDAFIIADRIDSIYEYVVQDVSCGGAMWLEWESTGVSYKEQETGLEF